jgi:hypothetical protein
MANSTAVNRGIRSYRRATLKSFWIACLGLLLIVAVMRTTLLPESVQFGRERSTIQDSASSARRVGEQVTSTAKSADKDSSDTALAIWLLSAGVLAFGLARGFLETRVLKQEWDALDLLQGSQDQIASRYPQTVVAGRVAAVMAAVEQRRVEREFRQSNRALASSSLAGVGALTRFGSSSLLVLAVLGTFAGMKGAMPGLIDAIKDATSASNNGAGMTSIAQSLEMVTNAFGANFLALFGSLLLALLAFGATLERRDFLTMLEVMSERRLYLQLPTDADATELERAVGELQRSVAAVASIGYAVDRLGGGISDLRGMLRETMSDMQSAFSSTIQQHAIRTQQHMNDAIGQLVSTLGTTSQALDATAVSYQGLVRGLEERDLGVRKAADAMAEHSRELTAMAERSAKSTMQAAEVTTGASKLLEHVTSLTDNAMTVFVRSADEISASVGAQSAHLEKAIGILANVEQQGRTSGLLLERVQAHLAEEPQNAQQRHEALLREIGVRVASLSEEARESNHSLGMVMSGHADSQSRAIKDGVTAALAGLLELRDVSTRSRAEIAKLVVDSVKSEISAARAVDQGRLDHAVGLVLEKVNAALERSSDLAQTNGGAVVTALQGLVQATTESADRTVAAVNALQGAVARPQAGLKLDLTSDSQQGSRA